MADNITIKLDTSKYQAPSLEDVTAAKRYVLRREDTARALEDRIDDILREVAEQVVIICYKYNVNPKEFTITASYNKDMMAEISAVMDDAEDAILDLIDDYATRCTDDRERKNILWLWIATLGSRNRTLAQTL